MIVVLPAPFGPRRPNTSPRRTESDTSLTAVFHALSFFSLVCGNFLTRCSISIIMSLSMYQSARNWMPAIRRAFSMTAITARVTAKPSSTAV